MKVYTHLSLKERRRIYVFKDMKLTPLEIAKRLGRHRSTIYRELKRNSEGNYYLPDTAHRLTQSRCKKPSFRITTNTALYDYILRRLKDSWSPEQISGRMKLENKPYYACPETIYRYIYRRSNKGMYRCLARKKPQRGTRYGRKVGSGKFAGIRLIDQRPIEIETRQNIGHWEGDTIGFSSSKYENITTLVERKIRYVKLIKNSNRTSNEVMGSIKGLIKQGSCPKKLWKTLTFDQGSEFADFRTIDRETKCKTYFCNPHSPWQRGTNENMNGRLRRYLPRETRIQDITQNRLDQLSKKLNNLPRKCLGFMTPREALLLNCKTICRTSF